MKLIYKTLKNVLAIVVVVFTMGIAQAQFSSKGPYGGSVTCATTDTSNAVYIGTAEGGVYESTNSNLVAWRARPVGLKSGKIKALAHTGSYLFTATADSGVFIFSGYMGSDRYWKKANNGLTNLNTTSLAALDTITVLVGTNGGGIFKTINKGVTWTSVNSTLTNLIITAFAKSGNRIIHTSAGGVFASDDNGATWFDFNDINTNNINTAAISYNAATDEILIANNTGLYIASLASSTLSPAYTTAQTGLPVNTNVRAISNDGTTWYIATDNGVFTSPAGAISWISKNNGLTTLDVTAIVPFMANIVAGTSGEGVFQTAAISPFWVQNNNGFNNIETYAVATSGATIVAAATEKGVFISTDTANSYTLSNAGLTDSLNVTDITFFANKLYAATANAGVFVSTDTGNSWTVFNTGLSSNLQMEQIAASSTNIYTYNSAGEVFVSNGSSAWAAIQTGLPGGVQPASFAFYGTTVLLGTLGNGAYTKSESGGSWTASNTGLTNMNVTSVTASEGKFYAGTDGAGVFVSDVAAIGWSAATALSVPFTVTIGLNGSRIQAMAAYAGYVFASYKGGVLATADSGATWIEAGSQFDLPSYSNINKMSFVTTHIFATTERNSLYSNALSELQLNSHISASTNTSCYGTCNGTATILAIGGTPPYTYMWSNGSTTSTVSNLCAQTYTVTVTDGVSATSAKTVTIAEPTELILTTSSTTSTTGSDGTATATVSGSVGPYTYSWNTGGTSATLTGIGAGNYMITVTDANGCIVADTAVVTGVVGIDETLNNIGSFTFYPNPTDGNIMVSLKNIKADVKTIAIYDLTGKLMRSFANAGWPQTVKLSVNCSAGIYQIRVTTNKGIITQKLIIQ